MDNDIEIIDDIDNQSVDSKIVEPNNPPKSTNNNFGKKNNFTGVNRPDLISSRQNRINQNRRNFLSKDTPKDNNELKNKIDNSKSNSKINSIIGKKNKYFESSDENTKSENNSNNKKEKITKDDITKEDKSSLNAFKKKKKEQKKSLILKEKKVIKKKFIQKILLWLTPILGTAVLYALVCFLAVIVILTPLLYITNKFNLFKSLYTVQEGDSEEVIKWKEERMASFYSELSYDEMINRKFLNNEPNYNPSEIDYVTGINIIYNGTNYGNSSGGYIGGTGVPYTDVVNAGPFTSWRQYDSRWANNRLGSSSTIGKVGCLITAVAIQMARTGTRINASEIKGEFNPASFNNWLNNNDGYSGNLFIWGSTKGLAPNFNYMGQIRLSGTYQEKYNTVSSYYNSGYIIVLEVGKNEHWVAVTTVSNNVISMIDPASDSTNAGSRYYNLEYANLFAYYKVS